MRGGVPGELRLRTAEPSRKFRWGTFREGAVRNLPESFGGAPFGKVQVVTMNFRELLHVFRLRINPAAQWEIREVCVRMLECACHSERSEESAFIPLHRKSPLRTHHLSGGRRCT